MVNPTVENAGDSPSRSRVPGGGRPPTDMAHPGDGVPSVRRADGHGAASMGERAAARTRSSLRQGLMSSSQDRRGHDARGRPGRLAPAPRCPTRRRRVLRSGAADVAMAGPASTGVVAPLLAALARWQFTPDRGGDANDARAEDPGARACAGGRARRTRNRRSGADSSAVQPIVTMCVQFGDVLPLWLPMGCPELSMCPQDKAPSSLRWNVTFGPIPIPPRTPPSRRLGDRRDVTVSAVTGSPRRRGPARAGEPWLSLRPPPGRGLPGAGLGSMPFS
jgi:hypothetical protein